MIFIANIKDVAKEANVSVATVSRVLNKTCHVSPDIAETVQEVAKKLGYSPNLLGKNLRKKQTGVVFVLLSTLTNSHCAKVVSGIAAEAEQKNYHILVCATGDDPEREKVYLDLVKNRMADGMIVLNSTLSSEEIAELSETVTMVQVSEYTEVENVPYVSIDNRVAAEEATTRLIQNGKRNILFVGVDNELSSSKLRLEGYRAALKKHGIEYDDKLVIFSNYGYRNTMREVDQYISSGNRFDAIFAISDRMAAGAMKALGRHGLKIPEDVEVIGFDNTDIAYMIEPGLTTVSQPQREMGKVAMKLLHKKIKGQSAKSVVLAHKIIVRESAK